MKPQQQQPPRCKRCGRVIKGRCICGNEPGDGPGWMRRLVSRGVQVVTK